MDKARAKGSTRWLAISLVGSLAVVFAGIGLTFFHAPVEGTLGIVQKIFYFHVPSAIAMEMGFFGCAAGSIWYLLKPNARADRIAHACAEVGVVFGLCVLVSGPLWAYKSWGTYWEWEPRLTSMVMTFLIYVAYLLVRTFSGSGEAARKIGAVMGVLGIVGVALVKVAVRLWGGVHPQVMTGEGDGIASSMMPAFYTCMLGILWLAVSLIWLRASIQGQREEVEELHLLVQDLEYEAEMGRPIATA